MKNLLLGLLLLTGCGTTQPYPVIVPQPQTGNPPPIVPYQHACMVYFYGVNHECTQQYITYCGSSFFCNDGVYYCVRGWDVLSCL